MNRNFSASSTKATHIQGKERKVGNPSPATFWGAHAGKSFHSAQSKDPFISQSNLTLLSKIVQVDDCEREDNLDNKKSGINKSGSVFGDLKVISEKKFNAPRKVIAPFNYKDSCVRTSITAGKQVCNKKFSAEKLKSIEVKGNNTEPSANIGASIQSVVISGVEHDNILSENNGINR